MKNLKISAKLLVGFGTIVVLVVALGLVSILNLANINSVVDMYVKKTVPNTEYIWDIRVEMVSVERYLGEAIASTTHETKLEMVDNALEVRQKLTDAIDLFNANTRTDPALMADYQSVLNQAAAYRDQIVEILKLPPSDENDKKALEIFENNYIPTFDAANEKLLLVADAVKTLSKAQEAEASGAAYVARSTVFFVTLLVAAIAVLMVLLIRKSIVTPVREIEKAAQQMAVGKLDAKITYKSRDELGALAESMRRSMATINTYIVDIDRAMKEMSVGNFDLDPSQPFVGDFKHIEESISTMIVQMCSTLSQINMASSQVSSGSDQVSSGAQALAQGATEQASSVEELSAAINEISGNVKQNADNAQKANNMASEATASIEASNDQMQQLMKSMDDIESKSHEISKIIKAIEDIAFQTNILALNAAVEAARAGAAGKGFAVVADEVRNLAAKSADAAKNTTTLIESSVTAIGEGVRLADTTAEKLNQAVQSVVSTTGVISEIMKASEEQAESIAQVSVGIDQISAVVQTNSATSEESAAASEELSSQANLLKSLIAHFRLKVIPGVTDVASSGAQYGMQQQAPKWLESGQNPPMM